MTDQPAQPDPRHLLAASFGAASAVVDQVGDDDLGRPTPCTEWSVRDLLAHLLAVENRIALIAGGAHHDGLPRRLDADDDTAAGWAAAWRTRWLPVLDALADDEVLGRTWHHPAGDMPGARALFIYVSELTVHTWDLAAALGIPHGIDPALAQGLLGAMEAALPAEGREHEQVPFGAVVATPDDADVVDRLAAWVGRDPAWTPAAIGA